eukprot:5903215-Prymnesium_polylepis.1
MPPRKRARASAPSVDSVETVVLDGGEPQHSGVISLWRNGQFTDTAVTVGGEIFRAHRVVLAAGGSAYFSSLLDSTMRDASNPSIKGEDIPAVAFKPCLSFLYEGRCELEQALLLPVLEAAHYLGMEQLKDSAVVAMRARLAPSNALSLWAHAAHLELPALEKAAKELALSKFEELGDSLVEEASVEQMQALLADERLEATSEEAIFELVARFADAQQPPEQALFGLLQNVRFSLMTRDFLLRRVKQWPPLDTKAGRDLLLDALLPAAAPVP